MTDACGCATNPNPHPHRFLRPRMVAAVINRPWQTVDSWRKRGDIPATGEGYGGVKVCVCCAAEMATKTAVRWSKRARRRLSAPRVNTAA